MSSPKDQFDSAVKVIRALPKNGSYQPSPDLMKKFYGYYKQATVGPCRQSKPGFWDVINKAKWEAWSSLGEMPKEEAMTGYVNEILKIVETVPHTPEVSEFMHVLGPFFETVNVKEPERNEYDDEDMDNTDAPIPNGNSQHSHSSRPNGSPLIDEEEWSFEESGGGGGGSLVIDQTASAMLQDSLPQPPSPVVGQNGVIIVEGAPTGNSSLTSDTDSGSEEFCDSVDQQDFQQPTSPMRLEGADDGDQLLKGIVQKGGGGNPQQGQGGQRWERNQERYLGMTPTRARDTSQRSSQYQGSSGPRRGHSGGGGQDGDGDTPRSSRNHATQQIVVALERLQHDMNSVLTRLNQLETITTSRHQAEARASSGSASIKEAGHSQPVWWPFKGLSGRTMFFILVWPFIVNWVINIIFKRRSRRR